MILEIISKKYRLIQKSTCIALAEDNIVIALFTGPQCIENARLMASALMEIDDIHSQHSIIDDLPGMWHESDLSGGYADCANDSDKEQQ